MAKYDLTNAIPFNEQPLYKQGYEDAIDKACEYYCKICAYYNTCKETDNFGCGAVRNLRKAMKE